MLKVHVIPCNIQLPACFSVIEVESICLFLSGFARKRFLIDEAACLIVHRLVVCIDIE